MDWNLDSSRPIWPQIEEQLKRMIVSGRFGPGDQFPTVRELAEDAKVNPNTMQRALSQLEAEGLIVTMRTAGRKVTEDEARIESVRQHIIEESIRSFYREVSSLGVTIEQIIEAMRNEASWDADDTDDTDDTDGIEDEDNTQEGEVLREGGENK